MKKRNICGGIALVLALVLCTCKVETNYTTDGQHYGKAFVHNEYGSGKTITDIDVFSAYSPNYNNRYPSFSYLYPGQSSQEYKLELWLGPYDILYNGYRITITLDDSTTKSLNIYAHEDVVNNLYFDGTNLVER